MTGELAEIILIVFCVLGFGSNLFLRVIFLYADWQNGEEINWWKQFYLTFAVPVAFVIAILGSMVGLGFFSSQPAVFDFTQQTR